MDGLKGAHIGQPRGHYAIYYRQGLWDGSSTYTVLHETYEIIHETLWDMNSGDAPDRKVCREADRFAAAVLMQPEAFASMALASGLDVLALQRAYHCSYASVTIRLIEVLRDPPLMVVLYARDEKGDPQAGPSRPTCGPPSSGGRGASGRLRPSSSPASREASPAGGRPIPPGSRRNRPPATARRGTPTMAAAPP